MYSAIAANKRKTVLIMFLFVALIALLGWLYMQITSGGPSIFIGVLIGAGIYTLVSYFISARMALAINRARRIEKRDNPRLYRIVENLTIAEGMPMPAVYIMDDPAPNAFATGRDPYHASVCATTGILELLNDKELEGVMAHELGHIKNYDIRVNMIAFAMVAVIGLLADILLRLSFFRDGDEDTGSLGLVLGIAGAILAPLAATLIQLAISRQREYLADATGAMTTRYPEGLASALEKIGSHGSALKGRQNASTAHMFFANPLRGKSVSSLFATHPPIEDRVKRLRDNATKV
ncbi:MAG: M48 family metalloprotease [Candidatus Saccharimonadales bacterium]